MLILITGIPNAGKSCVMEYIKVKYPTVIIDEYVESVYQFGQPGYNIIRQTFGSNYVDDKCVNKIALRNLVLKDENAHKLLNEKIWPLIKKYLLTLKNSKQNYVVEMAIYMLDKDKLFANIFDYVIELKPDFKIINSKGLYEQWYQNSGHVKIDCKIINHTLAQTWKEISDVLKFRFKTI